VRRAIASRACCLCRGSPRSLTGPAEARRGERGPRHQQARLHVALDDLLAGERRRGAVRRVLRRERADRRDWNSPLLPGKNGSGAQLRSRCRRAASDRSASTRSAPASNMPKSNAPADLKMLECSRWPTTSTKPRPRSTKLAGRDRCGEVFLLGHSEGSIHAFVGGPSDPRRRTGASAASSACPGPRARS